MAVNQNMVVVAAFVAGIATAATTSTLLREAPGEKVYYVQEMRVMQSPNGNGGNTIVTRIDHSAATLTLKDGSTSAVDLDKINCDLSKDAQAELQKILDGEARDCVASAP